MDEKAKDKLSSKEPTPTLPGVLRNARDIMEVRCGTLLKAPMPVLLTRTEADYIRFALNRVVEVWEENKEWAREAVKQSGINNPEKN